jgi:hypothetical protein
MNNEELELIQLTMIHLTPSNRQFLYVILYFLTQCIRNKQFCSNETNKFRVKFVNLYQNPTKIFILYEKIYRSFAKLIPIHHDEKIGLTNILDCFVEHYGKLFDISMEIKKIVSRRLTKSKKENKVNSLQCLL